METLIGLLGAALALMALFFLYIGGAALVLRLVDWLRPEMSGPKQEPNSSMPTP